MVLRRSFKICTIIIFISCFLFSQASKAAGNEPTVTQQAGGGIINESSLISGLGTGHISEGHYIPVLFIWHIGMSLKRLFPQLQSAERLSLFLEPQFNLVTNPSADFEVGLGIGVQYLHPFSERISGYILASIGPNFISVVTKDQANGLNFSDLIGVGLYYYLSKYSAVNVGYRYRHMSNADLKLPNGGINTQFITFGYSVFF